MKCLIRHSLWQYKINMKLHIKFKLTLLFLLGFISNLLFAQTTDNPFYSNGKIYVVVTVISIIFVGIIVYLIRIDSRLRKTERELKEK